MKPLIHTGLTEDRWFSFSIFEQLGNVGSEFERSAAAFQRGDGARFERAFERMLELLDLTIADPKWLNGCRLRELLRLREEVCDVFHGNEVYGTPIDVLKRYFLYFGIAARADR
ncbi:MAG TPA: hypothetical protein VNS63_23605 [Blastocatellia bacterium]|nr:hypothetical protein [Blastocatellia bacterium]